MGVEAGGEGVGRLEGVGLGGRGSEVGSRGGGRLGGRLGSGGGVRTPRTYEVITNTHATINVNDYGKHNCMPRRAKEF